MTQQMTASPVAVVQRMSENAHAADGLGSMDRGFQGELQRRSGMPLPLIIFVDGKLPEKCHRYGVGPIALLPLGQKGALDVTIAQGHVADDATMRPV